MASAKMNLLQITLLVAELLTERRFDEVSQLASQDERAFRQLVEKLRVVDGALCFSAAAALAKVGEPALTPLVEALQDSQYPVRQAVALALGELKNTRAVEPLIGALGDDHEYVRQAAAASLSKTGDARAVQPLIGTTRDDNVLVRRMAVIALGQIGDDSALPSLERLAAEDIDRVAQAAKEAIRRIREPLE